MRGEDRRRYRPLSCACRSLPEHAEGGTTFEPCGARLAADRRVASATLRGLKLETWRPDRTRVLHFAMSVASSQPLLGDHSKNGQEEVYLVLDGSADFEIDGQQVSLDRQRMLRVGASARR